MVRRRFLRWFIIIICLYMIVTTSQAIVDLWRAGDKLTSREQELAGLEAQQKELLKQKETVESQEYLERAARNQLGLSKPGEEVIIIPSDLLATGQTASPEAIPNWKKWWRLWF